MLRRPCMALCTVITLAAQTARADDGQVTVLDWAGYDAEGVYSDYVEKNGGKPTYSFFASDEEAFQKLVSGFRADVAHPCSQMIPKYREAGLIEPWDPAKITDLADIDPNLLSSDFIQDDEGIWFLPADWGSTAIAYNTKEVPAEDVATLQVFVDPKYAGRTALPETGSDVWALAYMATGVTNWSDVTDEQFAAAAAWLRKAHANARSYWSDASQLAQMMATGEILVAWSWNDGVNQLVKQGYPAAFQRDAKEGSASWFCGFVNLKDGPNDEQKAYDFVNSWLSQKAAASLFNDFGYGHSNRAGMAGLDQAAVAAAGLAQTSAPVFAETPQRDDLLQRQLEEFDRIKAGY